MMKKITIFLTALLLLTACSNKAEENNTDVLTSAAATAESADNSTETIAAIKDWGEPDFRNVNWGMSKDEVIAIEGAPDRERAGDKMYYYLGYDVTFSDYEAELNYWFENGALVHVEYLFNCVGKTDLQMNTMYFKVLDEYVSEYGSPDKSSHLIFDSDLDVSEYPYISDPDFNFGRYSMYSDRWNNVSGAVITIGFVPLEDDESSFTIEHTAIGDNSLYDILASIYDDIPAAPLE